MAWNGPIVGAGGVDAKYFTSRFFIEKAEGPASPTRCACAAALAPTRATPSAAAAGPAEGSFTCANRSTASPLAYLPSSVVPGLAFSPFPDALQECAFAPHSTTVPEFAYAGTRVQTYFRADITPGNALAHTHFTPGPST